MKKGLIQIYTGEGKGKTTAAVGLTVRAAGHGLKVGFFQFFKYPVSGEVKILKNLVNVKFYSFLKKHPAFEKFENSEIEKYKSEIKKILKRILNLIEKENFDIVILDEILIALRDGFLSESDLVDFLQQKPDETEFVLTGRCRIGRKLKKIASLITRMENIKHPFPEIKAREGIEF